MLTIGLVQQSAWDLPIDSMPLAAGYLKAILAADPEISGEVDTRIYNMRGGWSLTEMAQAIFTDTIPDILGFSVVGWNYRNFACLSELFKQVNCSGLVVFGGNHVSYQAEKVFRECPSVDVIVNGEGEVTFRELVAAVLRDRRDPDFPQVSGISYRLPDGSHVTTADRERLNDLDVIPSPFLTGAIPMTDHLGRFPYEFALMETNRGCPYKCSFCYWGGAVGQRVRSFSAERLAAELQFFAEHQVPTVFLCDANFGMLAADEEFVEELLNNKSKYGFPQALEANWAKTKSERFRRIVKLLKASGLKSSFTLALQTLSDEALADMGRRNMRLNQWEELVEWLRAQGMDAFVELIWGAPGETGESFLTGYDRLAEHIPRIAVYPLLLLPNTEYSEQREKHGFVTLRGQHDDFEYVLGNRTIGLAENFAMQRFIFLARLLGENQYFKRLWRPARVLGGMTQSDVIMSLLGWINSSRHPSVAAFRESIPVIAESPAVASGQRLLYSDPRVDEEIERWWTDTVVPRFRPAWQPWAAQLYRFERWCRPVYQPPGEPLPPGWHVEADAYVSDPVTFGWPMMEALDSLAAAEPPHPPDPPDPPAPTPTTYEFRGARGFYLHLDNHETGAHFFTQAQVILPSAPPTLLSGR